MDSLRIILFIIGAVFIAAVYFWDRFKRGKNKNRYERWGVADDGAETHVTGRNSGDPETDSKLVSTAYETESYDAVYEDDIDEEIDDNIDIANEFDNRLADLVSEENNDRQSEVHANLEDNVVVDDLEPDLDSDPEISVNPIEDITSELEALEEIISHEPEQNEMELGDLDLATKPATLQPERIIAIHVLAREGSSFRGEDILSKLTDLDLQLGEMNTFDRLDMNNKPIFSLANAVEPGVFDSATMNEMSTPALLFILSLPTSIAALEAYDSMLDAARSLADALNGRLCDETRSVLTRQAIDELRTELNTI